MAGAYGRAKLRREAMGTGKPEQDKSWREPSARPPRSRSQGSRSLLVALAIAATLGIGLLLLSRFVAETRSGSFLLGAAWVLVVAIAVLAFARSRPEHRLVAFASLAVTTVAIAGIGYWTAFRERTVNENVVVAGEVATGSEREAALAGSGAENDFAVEEMASEARTGAQPQVKAKPGKPKPKPKPAGPVSLAAGSFTGADGHAGTGKAEVIDEDGDRTLTFTEFDVDPGPDVQVYLTPNVGDVSDRIELGALKGTQGNQQYSIPGDANLSKYDSVVLYCTPFTVRVATAELS